MDSRERKKQMDEAASVKAEFPHVAYRKEATSFMSKRITEDMAYKAIPNETCGKLRRELYQSVLYLLLANSPGGER